MEDANLPPPPVLGLNRLNLGGGRALKPRAKPEKFTDYKIEQFLHHRGKNATERLRELDKIRMYTPLPDEIQLLNVTPYRMNLLVMQDVMYLCGGLVGVRFSSEELQELLRLTKGMNSAWNDVSKAFQEMTTACKKLSLPVEETIPGAAVSEQTGDDMDLVKKLHTSADEYVQLFAQLQVFVKEKQKGVDPSARTDAPKLEADPESKLGRKLPQWLSVLIDKHQAALAMETAETVPTVARVPADTVKAEGTAISAAPAAAPFRTSKLKVGELSVYLSGCVTGLVMSSVDEQEAIAVLVQASNDTVMSVSNSDIDSATASSDHHHHDHSHPTQQSGRSSPSLFAGGGGATPRGRHYWARRFYNFLSKMTELATAIKDESALEKV